MSRSSLTRFAMLFAALTLAVSAAAQTSTWQIDPAHSSAQFSVKHLGVSTVRGAFTKVSGTAKYNPADPSKTSVDVTIDASSVDTRVDMRDKDLRSPNFLDVEKYPTITFHSKHAESAAPGKLRITGDLTIKTTTKEVVLDVDGPSAAIKDPWGNQRVGASASTKINRNDFGVSADAGMIGDDLTITIDAELFQPPAK